MLNLMQTESNNAEIRYKDLAGKLEKVEQRTEAMEKRINDVEDTTEAVANTVVDLQAEVNVLKQDKLSKNVVIKGIPEIETENDELKELIDKILIMLTGDVTIENVTYTSRFGASKSNSKTPRPILMKFKCDEIKQRVLKLKKKSSINCSMFMGPKSLGADKKWGADIDIIYFGDHMTPASNKIYQEARKLKKDHKVDSVWTTNGTTFIRAARGLQAIKIQSEKDIENCQQPRRSKRKKPPTPEKPPPDAKKDKQQ